MANAHTSIQVTSNEGLRALRAQAQIAFQDAEAEKIQEQIHVTEQEAQIQKYAKMTALPRRKAENKTIVPNRRRPDRKSQSPPTSECEGKRVDKLRPIQDVLHRLRWDGMYELQEYVVGYLERFEGILEMSVEKFIHLSDDYSEEDWIPLHRVRYVKRVTDVEGDEVVWDRDRKIDRIFGSTTVDQKGLALGDSASVVTDSTIGGVQLC